MPSGLLPEPTEIGLPKPEPTVTWLEVPPLPEYVVEELAAASPPDAPVDQPDEVAELVDWAKLRLSYVAQNEGATKLLMRLWPVGLPTPKQGVKTVEQANEILSLLTKVEADFELGFVEGGPQSSGHRSTRKGK